MSRYTTLPPPALAVLAVIQPHSSLRPISLGEVLRSRVCTQSECPKALQALLDARLITTMRHTVEGVATVVYWPTGLKPITPPTLEEIRMSSEPKNTQLARMILNHGPISGIDLAAKATAAGMNCPAKNIQGILGGHITRGEIILKKRDGANWYMTPNQAADWDDPSQTATEESAQLAELKSQIHDLLNDVAAANLIFSQMQEKLRVDRPEDIPGALDEIMQAAAKRVVQTTQPIGLMALLLIDSADLIQIEALDQYDTVNARELAMRHIEHGNAARAMVVSIIGEAKRNVEWKEAV